MSAAIRLGVSQRALEAEYYMIDLPEILRHKTAQTAEERLMALQIASMSQSTDKDAYGRFVDHLKADLNNGNNNEVRGDRLDTEGLAKLRQRIGRR